MKMRGGRRSSTFWDGAVNGRRQDPWLMLVYRFKRQTAI